MSWASRRHSAIYTLRRRSPPTVPDVETLQRQQDSAYRRLSQANLLTPTGTPRIGSPQPTDDDSPRSELRIMSPVVDLRLLDYVSDYDTNLMCPICRSPFLDPVVLSECEHCFCRGCLRQSWNSSDYTPGIPKGKCPSCRSNCMLLDRGSVPRILINILDDLLVKCPHHQIGCPAQIKRCDVQDHVNTYCGHTLVACSDPACELTIRRKDDRGECLHFGVSCIDCRQTSTLADIERHWQTECADRKIDCNLCGSPVSYRSLSKHKEETCPEMTVPCSGEAYGCTVRASRGAIKLHQGQCHIASFAPYLDSQKTRLADMEEQQALTTRRMHILEASFTASTLR